jgi:hypothetical protein
MAAAVVALAFVVALLSVLVVGLLRSHADILRQLHELGGSQDRTSRPPTQVRPGVALPRGTGSAAAGADLAGLTPEGDAVQIAVRGADQHTLLLFLSSGCLACRGFWDALADRATLGIDGSIRPVAVTKGPQDESLSAIAALAPAEVPTVLSSQAWDDYDVPLAPYAILVSRDTGLIVGEGAGATWEQVRDLMAQAFADRDLGGDADLRQRVEALRRRRGATGDRDARTDQELLAAGIGPDHPSLWESPWDPEETST